MTAVIFTAVTSSEYISKKTQRKRFKDLCCGYNKILIVADENTYNVGGESVERGLADKSLTKVIFSGSKSSSSPMKPQ